MKQSIEFEVSGDNGTQAFWIAIDKRDVRLSTGGKATVELDDEIEHSIVWWFTGEPGGTLSVVGKLGEKKVVEIDKDKIPKKSIYGGGFKRFKLT